MKYIISLVGALLMGTLLMAQSGLHLPFAGSQPAAMLSQPAFHVNIQDGEYGLVGTAGYELGSNSLSLQNIFLDENVITEPIKDRIIADLGTPTQLRLGFQGEGMLYGKIGKVPLSLSFRIQQNGWFNFGQPHTLGLVLYGNVRYAGTEISDEVAYQLSNHQEIGLGSGYQWGKLAVGGRVKLLLGSMYSALDPFRYTLFTETLGTRIQFAGNYDLFQNMGNETPVGVGLDLGLTYGTDSTWLVGVALNDFGRINWNGNSIVGNFDIDYEGIEIVEFASLADGTNFIVADTLRELIFPDTVQGTAVQNLPSRLTLHGQYRNGKNLFGASAILGLTDQSIGSPQALLNLTYQRELFSFLTLGVNGFYGDITGGGIGAMAMGSVDVGRLCIGYIVQADNALGYLMPLTGRGISWNAGLSFSYYK